MFKNLDPVAGHLFILSLYLVCQWTDVLMNGFHFFSAMRLIDFVMLGVVIAKSLHQNGKKLQIT